LVVLVGLRELINRNSKVTAAAAGGAIVAIVVVSWSQSRSPAVEFPSQAYFSSDGGKTFYSDSASVTAPVMKNGKEVDAAKVFACKDGTKFVGYLERAIDDKAKAELDRLKAEAKARRTANPSAGPDSEIMSQFGQHLEVKRPNDKNWVKMDSPAASAVMMVKCPDGSNPQLVIP
jgi:hypothetical protein